ncbi:Sigma-F factor [Aeromonas rivipollensis]
MNKAQAYLRHQDSYVLVERHAPLVKRIAQHLLARLPSSVLLDDLIQAGMIGLLEASRNFDGSKGASFETYAGIRIRGAMLDEIRRGDWVPRSVHRNSRAIAEAIENVEQAHGRDARDTEVAANMGVSLGEYHAMLQDVSCGKIIGIEDLGVSEDVIGIPMTPAVTAALTIWRPSAFRAPWPNTSPACPNGKPWCCPCITTKSSTCVKSGKS